MKYWITIIAAVMMVMSFCGCALRFSPSDAIQQNQEFAETGSAAVADMIADTDPIHPLAVAVADAVKSASAYIGEPDVSVSRERVNALLSGDPVAVGNATTAVTNTSNQARADGALRPKAQDVLTEGNMWADVILDNLDIWAVLFGAVGAGTWIKRLRDQKNAVYDALKTTVDNIERVKDQMPATFYALQDKHLVGNQGEVIDAAGGTGPLDKTPA